MATRPKTYGEAMVTARQQLNRARLADPDEHFPYKHRAVMDLLAENPPMGPGVPGGIDGSEDTSRRAEDYTSDGIADASAAYVAAQQVYLEDPTVSNKDLYDAARDRLLAARLDHRQNRGDSFVIGAAARRS